MRHSCCKAVHYPTKWQSLQMDKPEIQSWIPFISWSQMKKSGQIWPKEILFKNAAKATKSNYFMCKNLHHLLKEANMHKWENLDITQHFSTKLSKFEFKIRILVNLGLPKLKNACLPLVFLTLHSWTILEFLKRTVYIWVTAVRVLLHL